MSMKTISVFGSARPLPGSPEYRLGYDVGRLLAEAGLAVATGGYMGTMEAVSKGAAEAGGHVIGVTSVRIEMFRPGGPNPYVVQETRYTTLRERLLHLVQENEGMIALPGGIGTLAEVAMAWNGLQTGETPRRPLVLLGAMWERTFQTFVDDRFVRPQDFDLLAFAATPEAAVASLLERLGSL